MIRHVNDETLSYCKFAEEIDRLMVKLYMGLFSIVII